MKTGPAERQRDRGRLSRWSRSNGIVFVVALLVLCGTTYAAAALPKNSVGTKQLKKGSVGTKQLKNGAVTAEKVKSGSLTGAQINASTLGTVPSASRAAIADNASHAENSDQLGGLLASAFQLRISGSCSGGSAIASVGSDGSVGCAGTGGPPSGPAGGDLSGTYPNPSIAGGAVITSKLAAEAVNSSKVAANSLTGANIDESSLGTVPNADTLDSKHAYEFLGVGATAVNSERLGNLLPNAFLQTGTNAGGDLSGTYPSPSVANGAITDAKVAAANKDGAAGVPSLRTLGTGPQQAMPGNATPGGPPTGSAGGALTGTFPNPTLNVSGGPCPNGKALTNLSASAALSCGPGIYTDGNHNLGAVFPVPFSALTLGSAETAVGYQALASVQDGGNNTAVGADALATTTTGGANSALGTVALQNNISGSFNSAIGVGALQANISGNDNSAVGVNALSSNNTGEANSAFGRNALQHNTTGAGNSAFGNYALQENVGQTGGNSAFGASAMQSNTSGEFNSAFGRAALSSNTDGQENAAFGEHALADDTGGFNTAVGSRALENNTTGPSNAAFGRHAMVANTTGGANTAFGTGAGQNLTTGGFNIDIGAEVSGGPGESNTIRIGNQGVQTRAFLAGVSGVTTEGVAAPVLVDANGQLGTTSSSRRFKQDIRPVGSQIKKLMALRPVSFRYRRSFVHGANPVQFGLIAEQVAKVYPNLVVRGEDGKPSAVAYQELPALLLAQVQRQQRENGALRAAVRRQQAQIDWLIRQVRQR